VEGHGEVGREVFWTGPGKGVMPASQKMFDILVLKW